MKKVVLFIFALTWFIAQSQPNWVNTYGNVVHEEVLDAATDGSGDIISVGYFTGPITIGSTTLSTAGNSDILVMKTDNTGTPIWAVKAGGTGPDRAYSVSVDPFGNSYITGYIYNAATFGSITVTANDRDAYAAKIDPNGNFLWVKNFGGQFGDTGYGIEVDHLQNVIVTGQYKGNGVFGPDNFTSTTDPNTGLPAYDFFLTKLDPAGNYLWTREANAKYDDRGMSVDSDEQGNIYVAGQFSDTITFQNTHNNSTMNAGFVIKYDISGNEIWMDKYRAAQVMLYDLKWQNDQLYLTGDFKGNMQVVHQGGTSTFPSGGDCNILVCKLNEAGVQNWFASNFSENEVSSKQLALDSNGDIYLAGLFKCDFTQMNELYGNSTFLSLGYRDVHYIKYLNNGTFQWARQFGSNEDDYCSAIVTNGVDHPVLAGSFDNWLVVPGTDAFSYANCQAPGFSLTSSNTNCGDLSYTEFCLRKTNGNKDIFICDPFDADRLPLDYYLHNTMCDYDTPVPCIEDCQDSLAVCASTVLDINFFHLAATKDTVNHPRYDYIWNTGGTQDTIHVNISGQYTVKISREDGCSTYDDTIFVTIHPLPAKPLISDNWGYYTNWGSEGSIDTCYTDSLLIQAIPGDIVTTSISWDLGVYINDSTRYIDTSGVYTVTALTDFGCSSSNAYNIVLDNFAIHDTLDPHIHFLDIELETTDTLYLCQDNVQTLAQLTDHNFIHSTGGFPFKTSHWYLDGGYVDSLYYFPPPNKNVTLAGLTAGWHTLDAHLVNECGDSVNYFVSRDFFVVIIPGPVINIVGPTIYGNYCPGDTVPIYVQTSDPSYSWSGPFVGTSGDTIFAIVNIANQNFIAYVDTITPHITCGSQDLYILPAYPSPQIVILDMNIHGGIVCPNDSLHLQALSGQAWVWIGPQGDTLATTQDVWVDLPGFYHCIVTDIYGCVLTSNFVEAKEYSAPVLTVDPFLICEGQTAEITVTANSLTDITWLAPLSGTGPVVTVDSAGTYYCTTDFCNIVQTDSVVVLLSVPVANITAVPSTVMCPGDTIQLFANAGMMNYWWNGSNEGLTVLETTSPGEYILTTETEAGCQTSDTITLAYLSNPLPPIVSDTTICPGDDITLYTSASDSVYWFNSGGLLLGDTDSLFLSNVTSVTNIIVKNKDSLCYSVGATLTINMGAGSVVNPIDTTICEGNAVVLQSNSAATVTWYDDAMNFLFSGPDYTTPVLLADATYYFEVNAAGLCATIEEAFVNVISDGYVPSIVSPALVCEDDSLVLWSGDYGVTDFSWFDTSGELSDSSSILIDTDVPGTYNYGLVLTFGSCMSDTAYIEITVNPLPTVGISALTPTGICPGDSVMLLATTNGDGLMWNTYEMDSLIAVTDEGDYQFIAMLNGCYTTSDTITITFNPTTVFYEYLDTIICEGESLTFDLNTSSDVVWIDIDLDTIGTADVYSTGPLYEDTEIYYQVTETGLCPTPWTPVYIQVIETGFTPVYTGMSDLCLGDSIIITADGIAENYYWIQNGDTLSTQPYIVMVPDNSGNVYVDLVTSSYGCFSDTAFISININDLPQFDLPTDTTLCDIEELYIATTYDYTIDWIYLTDSITSQVDTFAVITFTNNNGCTFTDTMQVFIEDCDLFMPNIFTPDNDGVNDVIGFSVEKGKILELKIQNRWGQMMYEGTNSEWNGEDKTGSPCVAGTYFYVIEFENVDGSVGVEQGWFFLSR